MKNLLNSLSLHSVPMPDKQPGKRLILSGLLSCLLLLLSACGGSSGVKVSPDKLEKIEATRSASVVWSGKAGEASTRDAVVLSPYVTEELLFTVGRNGKVTAFNIGDGSVVWDTELERDITAGISGDEENLYIATANGDVFAISQDHGGTIWTSPVSSEVIAAPVAGTDFVVVRSIDGKVYSLDKNTGQRRWIYSYNVPALSIHGNGRPLVAVDGVLAGLDNGRLVALRATDGQVFWETALGENTGRSEVEKLNDLDADLQIYDPYIYAVNYQGKVAQIDPAQGRPIWSADVSSVAGLAVDDAHVIVTDEFDTVHAFRRSDGETLWTHEDLSHRRLTAPVIVDGLIVVGDFEGYLHLLSAEDGSTIGRLRSGVGPIASKPIVRDDMLYVQSRSGRVAAVKL